MFQDLKNRLVDCNLLVVVVTSLFSYVYVFVGSIVALQARPIEKVFYIKFHINFIQKTFKEWEIYHAFIIEFFIWSMSHGRPYDTLDQIVSVQASEVVLDSFM